MRVGERAKALAALEETYAKTVGSRSSGCSVEPSTGQSFEVPRRFVACGPSASVGWPVGEESTTGCTGRPRPEARPPPYQAEARSLSSLVDEELRAFLND